MRILVSAVSAKMGGAANYLREIAAQLEALDLADEFIFLAPPEQAAKIREAFPTARVESGEMANAPFWKRFWFDQVTLRRRIRREKIDCLFSTADFGMLACPCRQVLLVRNPTYFFEIYLRKYSRLRPLKPRLLDSIRRWLVCRSVKAADFILTPSQAMLDELRRWVRVPDSKALPNLYGVNRDRFSRKPFAAKNSGGWNLLFVSLYADHKNLITLLRAIETLVGQGLDVNLVTTADPNWAVARTTMQEWAESSALAASPALQGRVHFALKDVTTAPKNLYRDADIFVYPSVVESFGHALAEAMASGLPVVTADVPINRELCGDAALYFSPFDPADFAAKINAVIEDATLRTRLSERAFQRSRLFSWEKHVSALVKAFRSQRQESVSQTHLGVQPTR